MLSKFFKHGAGNGSGPVDYVLGKDRNREGASLVHGDPELMVQLIDSLGNQKHKYTSGALSFSKHISDDEKALAIQGYERFLSADESVGLSTLWVEHTDKDRTELHFIVANVDLFSGRAYTPYVDKLDFGTRNALDDYLNVHISDADPDDPSRKRLCASAHDYITQSKDRKALIELIDKHIETLSAEQIGAGGVWTRAETKNALEGLGFNITRESKAGLSISHDDLAKNIRLKGAFYEPDTRLTADYFKENKRASEFYQLESGERAESSLSKFQAGMQKRSERVRERFEDSQIKHSQVQQNNISLGDSSESRLFDDSMDSSVLRPTTTKRHRKADEQKRTAETADSSIREQSSEESRRRYWELHNSTEWDERQLFLQGWTTEGLQTRVIPCYFKDGGKYLGSLQDYGHRLEAVDFKSDKAAAFNIVKQGLDKGWKNIEFSGSDEFVRHAMTYANQKGLEITPTNDTQREILKEVLEDDRTRKNAHRAITDADSTSEQIEQSSSNIRIDSSKLDSLSRELERQQQQLNSKSADFEQATKQLDSKVSETKEKDREMEMDR